ncbi:hypothetical protein [Flammeovirga kamogawensis]|uniref:Uncharacterized protein n=1 Tax=Flammeovirga kamogawensis TaxID=373891 RepID=A0ABX8H378_9BACT|nr:hypothetical protein [Flammeovirga kamogawensis]MBB6460465.1 uncharacterized protein YdeI (YjbR/CyaY-like superfamily) [Flammeovirga kamogawensis]QWG10271.1 hypothetical protein KM029_21550 [Flammeovirga kamogawensis]TRX64719.1 hypothetical protein EO216_19470 [Flammeovirga kamogawensis]
MLDNQAKMDLFGRVVSLSCTTEVDTQTTYNGIYQEYKYQDSSNVLKVISTERKKNRFEGRTTSLSEKKSQLTYVEGELETMLPTHSKYKEKVVEKNKLVAEISELELKLEQNDGLEVYFEQLDRIVQHTETYVLLELLHHIKDHATTNGWVLNSPQLKELEAVAV